MKMVSFYLNVMFGLVVQPWSPTHVFWIINRDREDQGSNWLHYWPWNIQAGYCTTLHTGNNMLEFQLIPFFQNCNHCSTKTREYWIKREQGKWHADASHISIILLWAFHCDIKSQTPFDNFIALHIQITLRYNICNRKDVVLEMKFKRRRWCRVMLGVDIFVVMATGQS